ncbi:nitrate- and nitrite sensing domain-containing protein [Sphaerisporangium sp. TRM90804]|uniref:sensor histidine kinase n=1 Tax=Sphaerisporangium sp. TRM90804 TaxID=3031113 RepID=UPI002449CD35|nr:nitrate- and nitrite sensing domain-containing protein [Sphaerisporangium sp. TRM90804]MDH2430087.1 nitrate- and nitrite sensing domain-containing protein [Sphaerisporangium sp. TRM90804]
MRTATVESGRRAMPDAAPPSAEPDAQAPPPGGPRKKSTALRNWRVRTRLIALILVPTLVAVLLGGLRVATSIQSAADYERVRTVAEFGINLADLVHELDLERDLAARYVANGRRGTQARLLITDQQNAVDAAAQIVADRRETVEPALGDIGRQALVRVLDRLAALRGLRQTVGDSQLPPLPSFQKYNLVIDDIMILSDEAARGGSDETLNARAAALASLARAAEQASRQRGLMTVALTSRQFGDAELVAFNTARAQQASELGVFQFRAGPAERQRYSDTVTGPLIDRAAGLVERVLVLTRERAELANLSGGAGSDVDYWFEAAGDGLDRMQVVQREIGRSVVDRAAELARDEQRQAAVNIGVVALLLILVLVITTVMARSLVTPLRRLRREALEIAGRRLPELVQKLRESESAAGPPEVRPIGVTSTDEVGEVARAFDEVHREAIRLASDEAQLRSNVSAMFVNLSRRTQTLVERQITLIDGLEQGEQDDNRLGDLFRLDHLATRMRRNSENLLVLAGQEPARRWSQPVPLLDVTRASLSEVENYERVAMHVPAGVSIAGQAVNDVIHLLAELVENAISFSPRETRVTMSANRIDGGGVMISITDAGIGMTDEELAQTNWRLANPPVVDVAVSRRMGLFVVGRLALRNGIRVQLRRHDGGGLTAMVLLPEALMGMPAHPGAGAAPAGQPSFEGSATPAWAATSGRPAAQGAFAAAGQAGVFGSNGAGPNGMGPMGPTTGGGFGGPPGGGFGGPATGPGGYGGPATGGGRHGGFDGPTMGTDAFGGPATGSGGFGGSATGPGGYGGPPGGYGGPPGGYGGPPGGGGGYGGPPTGPGGPSTGNFGGPPTGPRDPGGPAGPPTGPHRFGGPSSGPVGPGAGNDLPVRLRPRRYESPEGDAATGPLPAVRTSPMEQEEEYLPIFASVESAWFRRADPQQEAEQAAQPGWQEGAADAGWQAAAVVKEPVRDGTTQAGLPKRVPKANLVPGSAGASQAAQSPVPSMPPLSPDRARSRLSSFQQGIRQGRAVARGELSEDDVAFNPDPRRVHGDKEDK